MPSEKNRFGLSRHVPEHVAKTVRKHCGFGCVNCGSAIYDYEHFDPEFKDAAIHNPDGITLLCPTCHRKKGSLLSRKTLVKAASSPYCKMSGFSHTDMDIDNLTVNIGPFTANQCLIPLEVKLENSVEKAIWFEPPEEEGAPIRLNLAIFGNNGAKLAWIQNNVWHASTDNLDVKVISGLKRSKISVKRSDQNVIADLEFYPPNDIRIYKFASYYGNKFVEIIGNIKEGNLKINGRVVISGSHITAMRSRVAISI